MKKYVNRNPLPMILLLVPFLFLAFSNPFSEPAQTIETIDRKIEVTLTPQCRLTLSSQTSL